MKTSFFLCCAIFSCTLLFAQENNHYFQSIAGDSSIHFSNHILIKENIGDTATIKLSDGLYRIIFNQDIQVQHDIDLQIFNEQGQKIAIDKNDGYIDFVNPATGDLRFVTTASKSIEDETVAKIFWMYTKNINRDAPQFNLQDLDGKEYTKAGLKGKIVVINYWGIQCRPCRLEIPQLNKLVKQYKDRKDVVFLAISSDTVDELNAFRQDNEFNYQLISEKNALDFILELVNLGMMSLPTHAVLDKNGHIVFQYLGEHPKIEQMLSMTIDKHR